MSHVQLYEGFIPYGAGLSRGRAFGSSNEMAWLLLTFQSATTLSLYPAASYLLLQEH